MFADQVDVLIKHGYSIAQSDPTAITVLDPVYCSTGSMSHWVEYDAVTLRNTGEVIRFLSDRGHY